MDKVISLSSGKNGKWKMMICRGILVFALLVRPAGWMCEHLVP